MCPVGTRSGSAIIAGPFSLCLVLLRSVQLDREQNTARRRWLALGKFSGVFLCRSSGGSRRRANHPTRRSPSAAPRRRSRIPTAQSFSASRISRCPSTGAKWPPTSSPRSTSARPACRRGPSAPKRRKFRPGCGAPPPTSGASPSCRCMSARRARATHARCSTAWPAPGPTGAGRAAISPARTTPAPSSTSTATCWPCRWARPTARNGSTPACTGPTASTVPARATSTSITRQVS